MSRKIISHSGRTWSLPKLSAKPQHGGLGCLPYREHIQARHNKWAIKLIVQGSTTLWTQLAWNLLLVHRYHLPHKRGDCVIPIKTLLEGTQFPAFSGPEAQTYPQSIELIAWGIQRQLPPTWMRWKLSWQIGSSQIPLTKYSVQVGTHLLTLNQREQRQARYADWIRQISQQPCPPLSTALTPLSGEPNSTTTGKSRFGTSASMANCWQTYAHKAMHQTLWLQYLRPHARASTSFPRLSSGDFHLQYHPRAT